MKNGLNKETVDIKKTTAVALTQFSILMASRVGAAEVADITAGEMVVSIAVEAHQGKEGIDVAVEAVTVDPLEEEEEDLDSNRIITRDLEEVGEVDLSEEGGERRVVVALLSSNSFDAA